MANTTGTSITWRVGNGPVHTIPEGAVVVFTDSRKPQEMSTKTRIHFDKDGKAVVETI